MKKFDSRLPFRGGHVRQAQPHEGDGTCARRQGSEVLVSSVLRSWQWPLQGPPLSCESHEGGAEDSGYIRTTKNHEWNE